MTKDEALKLALDAFGEIAWSNETQWQRDRAKEAITAIKEALAQPEQEQLMSDQINYGMSVTQGGKRIDPMSIYKEPEQETTDSEMFKIRSAYQKGFEHGMEQSPQRKDSSADALIRQYVNALVANKPDEAANATKQMVDYVYTTPPQRKPLTDEEIILIVAECAASHQHTDIHFARAIERAHGIKELV